MEKKKLIILSIICICLLIILFSVYFINQPKVRVEDRFKEIQGFTFNYPIFDGWDVSSIKTSEIEGKIVSTISFQNIDNVKQVNNMQIKVVKSTKPFSVNLDSFDKNPNSIPYVINNDIITFYMKDFSVDVILFVFDEDDFSKSFMINRIVKTFIKN
ncbi:MAG: hypothetical protein WC867_06450 [Candidatus Pacearchaeota archaeon]|jgi:hypothetical protein